MEPYERLGTRAQNELDRAFRALPPPVPPVPRADALHHQCSVSAAAGQRVIAIEYDYRRILRLRDRFIVRCVKLVVH